MNRNLSDGFFLAAACYYVAALMHLAVAVLGQSVPLLALVVAAAFWAALATALLRRVRVLAWLGFLAGLGGGVVALGFAVPLWGLAQMIYLLIALACWLGALCLGSHLWRYRGAFRRI
ncbi:MAG: hypothetical protein GYB53_13945 [Rhodobacteraceae bacterium]|nr:hypothetical protein [Paracoccaceae bacterium]MBR9820586.1 hypothetical protein [Paracoccaceae bacterium]